MASISSSLNISISLNPNFKHTPIPLISPHTLSFSNPRKPNSNSLQFTCLAAKQSTNPVNKKRKKKPSSSSNTSKKKSDAYKGFGVSELIEEDEEEDGEVSAYQSMPKPPAGFVVDEQGKVVLVSNKRIVSIVSIGYLDCMLTFMQ